MYYNDDFYINNLQTIKKFYKKFKSTKFGVIDTKNIEYIKENAFKLKIYINNRYLNYNNLAKYSRAIEMINSNPKKYNLYLEEYKLLFIMFYIDSTFEMIKIFEEYNTNKEIQQKLLSKFGIYDLNIIKIEKEYIKTFFSEKEKKEIEEEISIRAFK